MERALVELQRLRELLKLEQEHEVAQFNDEVSKMPTERLVSRGMCWYPLLLGRSYYNSLNQFVVEVSRRVADTDDDDSAFEYGKTVQFFSIVGQERKVLPFTATVSYVDGERMVIALPSSQCVVQLSAVRDLGVMLGLDQVSYKAMNAALCRVIEAKSGRLPELRRVLHGDASPRFASLSPMAYPWLNASQQSAVNKVLCAKDVAVVHGPPGTGKTTTLVESICETLKRENQVLVCAQSNMAVDWICELLAERGVSVLRIGNPSRVTDKMLQFTYERQFAAHPLYHELWSIRRALRQRGKGNLDHQKRARLRDRATEIEIRINGEIMSGARVVASTLVGADHRLLDRCKFPTLFIDEAAQALEPACWIAIAKAGRVVLAGDHMQLPPTVKSPKAMREGLGKTLMEIAAERCKEAVTLLNVQYRMCDDIMRFSSEWFYGGQLLSAPEVQARGVLDFDYAMEWMDTSSLLPEESAEEFVGNGYGRINKAEAALLIDKLKLMLMRIGKERVLEESISIGVISPYKVQVNHLRGLIRSDAAFRPFRKLISVNTVDGFQGQERDIIIVSLVRANEKGQIGFLADLRRMNVAMTRARMKLVIIGNVQTLAHHEFYKKLYAYAQELRNDDEFDV